MTKRILFLTGRLSGGGSENVLFRHAAGLDRRRFVPEVLTFETGQALKAYEQERITVHGIPRGITAAQRVLRYRRVLRDRCTSGEVHLVHAWLTITSLIGPQVVRRAGALPVIASQRNLGYWLDPVRRQIYRWSNRRFVDAVIVNSEAVRKQMISERLCPEERIKVVLNGVDLSRFRPQDPRQARLALGLDPDLPTIGMVGTLKGIKGQRDLLGALALLQSDGLRPQVILVGDGPDREDLERALDDVPWRDSVRFLGRREDLEALYPAFDISVLCSRTEGFPNVVLESMASGCAVVVTPVGGVPEAVRDGVEGLHYAPGDVTGLARAIAKLLLDSELRKRMGRAGRERCERCFGWDTMQHTMEAIYDSVLEERRPTGQGGP